MEFCPEMFVFERNEKLLLFNAENQMIQSPMIDKSVPNMKYSDFQGLM